MNNRIAVFIDFDGTLYDNKTRTIPLSTIETLVITLEILSLTILIFLSS